MATVKIPKEFVDLMHGALETGTVPASLLDSILNTMDANSRTKGIIGLVGVIDTVSSALGKGILVKGIPVIGLSAATAELVLDSRQVVVDFDKNSYAADTVKASIEKCITEAFGSNVIRLFI